MLDQNTTIFLKKKNIFKKSLSIDIYNKLYRDTQWIKGLYRNKTDLEIQIFLNYLKYNIEDSI